MDPISLNIRKLQTMKQTMTFSPELNYEEQKKAIRSGYDMDVLPSDLVTYGGEAKKLLEDLQSRNERMFLVTVLVLKTAKMHIAMQTPTAMGSRWA